MKINFKTVMFATVVAMVGFASCVRTNDVNDSDKTRTVKIQVVNGSESRVVGPHVPSQAVVFSSGKLFFTTAGGLITKVVNIDNSNNAESGGVVGIDALKAGTMIQNVPGTSTKVYVLGNITATLPTITVGTTNISVINEFALQVSHLFDATNKAVANVPIYGAPGAIVPDGADYKANLTIAPIGARLEISKITGGGNITGFKVEGIFINNYYSQMKLNSATINTADLINNGNVPGFYIPDAAGGSYTGALSAIVYDYATAGIGYYLSGGICSPVTPEDNTKVWGYNLLAPTAAQMPHIVIRLSDVTTSLPSDPYAGKTWFLTIRNFYSDPGLNATPINVLEARNIYRITNLAFTEEDLAEKPEELYRKVTVTVDVLPWISNDIGYDFN